MAAGISKCLGAGDWLDIGANHVGTGVSVGKLEVADDQFVDSKDEQVVKSLLPRGENEADHCQGYELFAPADVGFDQEKVAEGFWRVGLDFLDAVGGEREFEEGVVVNLSQSHHEGEEK